MYSGGCGSIHGLDWSGCFEMVLNFALDGPSYWAPVEIRIRGSRAQ